MTDITAIVVSALSALKTTATERPKNPPNEMYTVRRLGGSGDRFTEQARIAVHCWAKSDNAAATMALQAAELLIALPDMAMNVSSASQDSLYSNDIDGEHRWSLNMLFTINR